MTTYTLTYHVTDDCPTCPWCVFRNADGELMAGFESVAEAEEFKAELEAEAIQFAAMAEEEARSEAEALLEEAEIEAELAEAA